MHPIGQNRIRLLGHRRNRLIESQVDRPRYLIFKQVIVKFQFPIGFEELSVTVVQEPLLQLLHVDVDELLVHLRVIRVDTVHS